MYRTNTCGELRLSDAGREVTLAGWVQRARKMGGMTFVDLRDRYGITQIVFESDSDTALFDAANKLGREFVVQVSGTVQERENKNKNLPTGEIEIIATSLKVLNRSDVPPFTIEDDTDGGDDLRMKYRYLDLRRSCVRGNLELRHRMAFEIRRYLDSKGFLEVETPVLIKSTPEGARDFVVPSRMNPGEFYALPQSPQTFKQLLMVSGFDRYFQIVKCFRDEDLRADRQPEFTQIDCEMSFVEQEDVLQMFEGLVKHIFKYVKDIDFADPFPRMTWADAMRLYGSDKPDTRFGMQFVELKDLTTGKGFAVMDDAEYVGAIVAPGCADYTRKQLDQLTEFVKRPQVGAKGMMWVKLENDGSIKSSVGKFYSDDELRGWLERGGANPGDLMLILAGATMKTRKQLNELRLEMGSRLGLRDPQKFSCLWVVDFPLFEWDDETQRYYAMHHPFTAPNPEDVDKLDTDTGAVRATAYDMVVNGNELGGGSIRIHDSELQDHMFRLLGLSEDEARYKFGFLMDAFKYGAPPHGGLAFGFDRFVSILAGLDSIRDVIAFPKNNSGRDMMIDAPSTIDQSQLDELSIAVTEPEKK
ncbi:aspartate--tRNA ligase [Paramuribaculum intestinale]|jgi:aspartyl-tRNA synthetase|uniref:Aspartate--tRNA ligase n=1 Tax=Paramuribaculum intestinale TaxID=2094151 RepID=A0A2V1J0T4_9BACT|nr:aspartate--tRNA ligase [Paramuribaculum intestinale]MBJ2185742.1 aspartate--tRNA ligase [Muribaculaceae bacterium]ROS92592.1 aspartate--tRNA ligase [Muribaculaceae bacterium Isolate-043 (Harlan)]ROT15354.1 aspartate--tRNA ligase [Muribaculaceae bacterium Isolate-105 (HZI)]MCX4329800.1 aspartate--tRNA ligase [Paramuribaculum intestinale]PWB07659.1 aspartate--tRNA ligase [Paramuribaculum intestinale]